MERTQLGDRHRLARGLLEWLSTVESGGQSWRHARVLSGPLADELGRLKDETGGDVIVYGGSRLGQSVIGSGLVDEHYFLVHPAALGRGLPIFSALEKPIVLELVYAKPSGAARSGICIDSAHTDARDGSRERRPQAE